MSCVLEGKAVHEETDRLIERANQAIAQSVLLIAENRSCSSQARAWLRWLYFQADEMKPKPALIAISDQSRLHRSRSSDHRARSEKAGSHRSR
jgi:hypothetical protein